MHQSLVIRTRLSMARQLMSVCEPRYPASSPNMVLRRDGLGMIQTRDSYIDYGRLINAAEQDRSAAAITELAFAEG